MSFKSFFLLAHVGI